MVHIWVLSTIIFVMLGIFTVWVFLKAEKDRWRPSKPWLIPRAILAFLLWPIILALLIADWMLDVFDTILHHKGR